jgi:hypothetical protein
VFYVGFWLDRLKGIQMALTFVQGRFGARCRFTLSAQDVLEDCWRNDGRLYSN